MSLLLRNDSPVCIVEKTYQQPYFTLLIVKIAFTLCFTNTRFHTHATWATSVKVIEVIKSKNSHPEQLLWEVSALIDPSVHGDEALHGGLVSDVGIVQAGV